jgi:broad specificity phosphatase PhoE
MSIIVIRHALSEANNHANIGTMAFGAKEAPLMKEGREQAKQRAKTLRTEYSVDAVSTPAAISRLRRTQETATYLGFTQLSRYAALDEVEHGMEGVELRSLLDSGRLPSSAILAVESLLQDPPRERVWVTHGLVIAGLCRVLNVSANYERLIPRFCEVRQLSL